MTPAELDTIMSVQDLLARYARLCDHREIDAWAALFTDDARFTVRDIEHRGEAIRQWLVDQSENPAGCHVNANISVTPEGADRATSLADFVFVRRQAGTGPWETVNVGWYEDVLVRIGDDWRFAERRIVLR
jgi:3-phenylpropionate/cinnamic acid dioxygenase small subunit